MKSFFYVDSCLIEVGIQLDTFWEYRSIILLNFDDDDGDNNSYNNNDND